jgi:threonine dehydrogenase-like Zn-dependent dehydrogenase
VKKAVIVGERQARLVDVPDPRAKGEWAVVKIQAAPMCTEFKAFVKGAPTEQLGHEAAGEVVEVARSGRVKVGDRVVVQPSSGCRECALCLAGDYIHCERRPDFAALHGTSDGQATMAQYILKPDWLLSPIPDDLDYDHASLACCALGPSFGAYQTLKVGAFDTVLVAGAGPVGLGAVVNARFRGAKVVVAEPLPWRAERALAMGAAAVVDPCDPDATQQISEAAGGVVDCAVDCAGTVPAQRLCVDATRRKGTVAFIGECTDELPIRVSPDMLRRGLTLVGNWHYNLRDYPKIVQVIRESPLIGLLLSHVLPMRQIQVALELSASAEHAKIVLHPWE